ncbi:hypothetical protein ACT3R5_14990 [Glutamicibacter sp. AOP5-A2-7]
MALRIVITDQERVAQHAVWAGVGSAGTELGTAGGWHGDFSTERLSFDTSINI